MKYRYLIILFIGLLTYSCSKKVNSPQESQTEVNPRMDKAMKRTAKDTIAIVKVTEEYLELLKQNQLEEAVNKLYDLRDGILYALREDQKVQMRSKLSEFPVFSFAITSYAIYSEFDTEVYYKTELFDKKGDVNQPNTMKFMIKPCRVKGKWYLTIPNIQRN